MKTTKKFALCLWLFGAFASTMASSLHAEEICELSATTDKSYPPGISDTYKISFNIDQHNVIMSPYAVVISAGKQSPLGPGSGSLKGTLGAMNFTNVYTTIEFNQASHVVTLIQQMGVDHKILQSHVGCTLTSPILDSIIINTTPISVKTTQIVSQNGEIDGAHNRVPMTSYSQIPLSTKLVNTSPVTMLEQFFTTNGTFLTQCHAVINGASAYVSLLASSSHPTTYSCKVQYP